MGDCCLHCHFPIAFRADSLRARVEIIGSNRAGLFINLVPIFGVLLSISVIGEPLHLYHVISLVLVMGGIVIAERNRPAV